jgi:hypothetical protein
MRMSEWEPRDDRVFGVMSDDIGSLADRCHKKVLGIRTQCATTPDYDRSAREATWSIAPNGTPRSPLHMLAS